MLTTKRTFSAGTRGVKARMVPGLRILTYDIGVDKVRGHVTQDIVGESLKNDIDKLTDDLASALTNPLSEEEKKPANVSLPENPEHSSRIFWSNKHMFAIVGGGMAGPMMTVLAV